MKHAKLLLLWALGIALLLACSEHAAPRFPHDLHLTELKCGGPGLPDCLSCASCHRPKAGARTAELPKVAVCEKCHKAGDQKALSAVNRPAQDPAPLAYGIRFFHGKHLAMKGIKGQCIPCHAGMVDNAETRFPPWRAASSATSTSSSGTTASARRATPARISPSSCRRRS